MYFRDANIALIVFDVTNKKSLDCVEYWADEVKRSEVEDSFIVLVGNKSDLSPRRQVTTAEGNKKAKDIGAILYYETSAVDNIQIQNLFQEIGQYLFKHNEEDVIPDVNYMLLIGFLGRYQVQEAWEQVNDFQNCHLCEFHEGHQWRPLPEESKKLLDKRRPITLKVIGEGQRQQGQEGWVLFQTVSSLTRINYPFHEMRVVYRLFYFKQVYIAY